MKKWEAVSRADPIAYWHQKEDDEEHGKALERDSE